LPVQQKVGSSDEKEKEKMVRENFKGSSNSTGLKIIWSPRPERTK